MMRITEDYTGRTGTRRFVSLYVRRRRKTKMMIIIIIIIIII